MILANQNNIDLFAVVSPLPDRATCPPVPITQGERHSLGAQLGFTKLDEGIILSSIWSESPEIRVVWVTLLAMADQAGDVHSSVPGLARAANIPMSTVESALEKFHLPDPYSRTKDREGIRIETIDGGWHLINHGKYRRYSYSDSPDAIRKRNKRTPPDMSGMSGQVPDISASVSSSSLIPESEQEGKAAKIADKIPPTIEDVREYIASRHYRVDPDAWYAHYESNGWRVGRNPMRSWKAAIVTWEKQHGNFAPPTRKEYNGPEKGSPSVPPAVRHEEYRAKKIAPEERAGPDFLAELRDQVEAKIGRTT